MHIIPEGYMSYTAVPAISSDIINRRNELVRRINRGPFWKPCPGTGEGYYCCGYQILTPLTGCGMYCSYCILQEYYEEHHQVLYENFDDCVNEIQQKLAEKKGVVRFGTGEFADSIYLERRLHLCEKIAALLEPYPQVLVEFKTKCAWVAPLHTIHDPSKVVIGFSMNTPHAISLLEQKTALLNERLEAVKQCEKMGFWIAFHFDPMVWYPEWEADYRMVVDRIFATMKNPKKIAWWSLGGFRTMPSLKHRLRGYGRHLPLFSGEMILGHDKKYRYFRPVRTAFYRLMQDAIERYYPDCTLYLCMESREVWTEAGMIRRIPQGLVHYLDERAKKMLVI